MSDIKKIIVFGASGKTGLQILKKGIKEGLEVTAYARTPSKIPEDVRKELHGVVEGDVSDKQAIENAIEGKHAVLSALGPGTGKLGATTVLSEGCSNILSGMRKHNVKYLRVISGAQILPSEAGFIATLVKTFVKPTDDHIKQIEMLENSKEDIDWIAMMPYNIKDRAEVNPDYKYEKDRVPGVIGVTTAELADFMINSLLDKTKAETFKHCKVGISSRSK